MSNEIWVALIGLAGSGIGSLIGVLASQKLTQYRIQQLEEKVSKHNKLIDRTYQLESKTELHDAQIEGIDERVKHLESYHQAQA